MQPDEMLRFVLGYDSEKNALANRIEDGLKVFGEFQASQQLYLPNMFTTFRC
jgi:hypothetical protein